MNRRDFLRAAMGSAAGLLVAKYVQASPQEYAATASNPVPTTYIHPKLASNRTAPVGARIVCLYDISGSINEVEHDIQLEVMAETIASEDFKNAIFYPGGPQSIAICVADFGDTGSVRVPWIDIAAGEEDKLKLLAHEIRGLKRREFGSTNHIAGMKIATECMANCPWQSKRSIVDILTDGEHNSGGPPAEIILLRDQLAIQHEATINALITLDSNTFELEKWAKEHLITPARFLKRNGALLDPGFVKIVATQQTDAGALVKYNDAMKIAFRRKLILEVAGIELDELHKITKAGAALQNINSFMPRPGIF
jgi:hypothetical protein